MKKVTETTVVFSVVDNNNVNDAFVDDVSREFDNAVQQAVRHFAADFASKHPYHTFVFERV